MEFLSNCDNAFQAIVFTLIFSDFTITSDSQLKIKNKNTKDKHLLSYTLSICFISL